MRVLLLLLVSAFVLSSASLLPPKLETSEVADISQESENNKLESVESNESVASAKDDSHSSEEPKDAMNEVKKNESLEESSSEEEKTSNIHRRRRSADSVRYRNLNLLATICPYRDTTVLEETTILDSRIEITEMYAICKDLPKNSGLGGKY
ncbi:uncharacterized protein LOC108087766 [Drosophila ficusphila]|uniref:uncharacterized protein LOC108087766 n=1 Tax=Drosophila ficusphila TaxID=30025 RepID=UPI0007E60B81|nr:uncharacterized protein LOC108087766 [Drosophila ficusphila]